MQTKSQYYSRIDDGNAKPLDAPLSNPVITHNIRIE